MVATTTQPLTTELANNEVKFISWSEVVENFNNGVWDYCEDDLYIRNIKILSEAALNKELDKKIEALLYVFPEEDIFFQVNDAISIYQNPVTNTWHIINGNTRVKALFKAKQSEEYKDVQVLDIPYKIEPYNESGILQLQIKANDTTNPHSVLDLAEKAATYQENRVKFYKEKGVKTQEAKSKATNDTRAFLGNKSEGYISQLKTIGASPTWVREMIREDLISCDTVRVIADKHKKAQKQNASLSLDFVYSGVRAIASVDNNRQEIRPSDVTAYFSSLTASNKSTETDEESEDSNDGSVVKFTTLQELLDSGKVTDDAVVGGRSLIENKILQEDKLVKGLTALLTDDKTILTFEDVKSVQDELTKKPVTQEEFTKNTELFESTLNTLNYQDINESDMINRDLEQLLSELTKYQSIATKHYPAGDIKELLPSIVSISLFLSKNDLTAYGDKLDTVGTAANTLKKSIVSRVENINKKIVANKNKGTATVEVEEATDIEDDETEDTVIVEDENFIAEITD